MGEALHLTPESAPPGRYILRENKPMANPFEAEVLEWSGGGRVKLRYSTGVESWRERHGSYAEFPWLVEALPEATPDDALIEEVRAMVERLNKTEGHSSFSSTHTRWYRNPDGPDAAALITRLLSTVSTTAALGEE